MAPKAVSSGKGPVQDHPRAGFGQIIMATKAQLPTGLFLL